MVQETHDAAMPTVTTATPGASVRATGRTAWLKVSSLVYLPALRVPVFGLLLVGAGWATRWGGVDFADSLTSLRFVTIGPLAVAMIDPFHIVERVHPAQLRPLVARGDDSD